MRGKLAQTLTSCRENTRELQPLLRLKYYFAEYLKSGYRNKVERFPLCRREASTGENPSHRENVALLPGLLEQSLSSGPLGSQEDLSSDCKRSQGAPANEINLCPWGKSTYKGRLRGAAGGILPALLRSVVLMESVLRLVMILQFI